MALKGELTQRQKKFCDEYIANGYNVMQAYTAVYGEKPDNKKPSYPYTLLKQPQVKEYIQARRQEIYESLNIDAIRIAQELASIAFAEKGDEVYTVANKLKALEQLSKNLGLQTQKIENSGVIEVTLEAEDETADSEEHI